MKFVAVLFIALLSSQIYAQDLPKVYKKLKKGNKRTYLRKLKKNAEIEKEIFSQEHYAIALKYDHKIANSRSLLEKLYRQNQLSDIGKIEFAGLLMNTLNYHRAIEILKSIDPSIILDDRIELMTSACLQLIDANCIEYRKEGKALKGLCYTFDATASMDPLLDEMSYSWNFDGQQKKEGISVDHCFEMSGTHYISLSSYDPISEIKNSDTTFTLSILPPLNFDEMEKRNLVNTPIPFTYMEEPQNGERVLWHFGNGIYNDGMGTTFEYIRAGNYFIEFFLIPKDVTGSSLKCNSYQLFIDQSKAAKMSRK